MRFRRSLVVAAIVATGAWPVVARAAQSAPDSARIAALTAAAAEWNAYRISTPNAVYSLRALDADAYGIVVRATPRRRTFLTTEDLDPLRVSWANIERVRSSPYWAHLSPW